MTTPNQRLAATLKSKRVKCHPRDLIDPAEQVQRYIATRKPGDAVTLYPHKTPTALANDCRYFTAKGFTVRELTPEHMADYGKAPAGGWAEPEWLQ